MEEQDVLSYSQVEKAVHALLQVVQKKESQPLLSEDKVVNLQFTTKKVVKQKQTIKLQLPNGLDYKDVCLFVKDLDRTDREYEKSVRHFKALLKSKGISCVTEIIPLKELKLEHKAFEAKRNLSNRFDVFLADARIIRLLPAFLGKAFFGKKRLPIQVRLDANDLKMEFDAAVNNSRCILSGKGSSGMATVGRTSMSQSELVQNIMNSAKQIIAALPGGADNIRNFHIKTEDSLAIPVYVSLGSANDVKLAKAGKSSEPVVAEEVSTVEDALVKVYPRGAVKLVDLSGKPFPKLKKKSITKTVKRAGKRSTKQSVSKANPKRTATVKHSNKQKFKVKNKSKVAREKSKK